MLLLAVHPHATACAFLFLLAFSVIPAHPAPATHHPQHSTRKLSSFRSQKSIGKALFGHSAESVLSSRPLMLECCSAQRMSRTARSLVQGALAAGTRRTVSFSPHTPSSSARNLVRVGAVVGTGAVALLAGGAALGLSTGWGAPSPGASCPQVQALPSYPTRPSSLVHSICTPWVLASASGAPDAQVRAVPPATVLRCNHDAMPLTFLFSCMLHPSQQVAALRKKLKDIFKRYASVEKDGEQFMTIQDFMSSILPADGLRCVSHTRC